MHGFHDHCKGILAANISGLIPRLNFAQRLQDIVSSQSVFLLLLLRFGDFLLLILCRFLERWHLFISRFVIEIDNIAILVFHLDDHLCADLLLLELLGYLLLHSSFFFSLLILLIARIFLLLRLNLPWTVILRASPCNTLIVHFQHGKQPIYFRLRRILALGRFGGHDLEFELLVPGFDSCFCEKVSIVDKRIKLL